MKKYIFALLCALAMTLIPQSVNAASDCDITVASGETKTINYYISSRDDRKDCHITNYGTLYIKGNASIYADSGYAINNQGGTVYIQGGTVISALYGAVWSNNGAIVITGNAALSNANGYEEHVAFAGESAKYEACTKNYTYDDSAAKEVKVTNTCQAPAKAPAKSQTSAPAENKETITITITTRKQTGSQNTNTQNTTTKSTPKTSAPSQSTKQSQPAAVKTPTEAKTEEKVETKVEVKTEEKVKEAKNEEVLPEAGESENSDNILAVIIAATIAVLGTASTAILVNRLRA